MKKTNQKRRWLCRTLCLLLALQFLFTMFPASEPEAADEDEATTWHWDRLDLITDTSPLNLKKYKAIMLVYEQYPVKYSMKCYQQTVNDIYILGSGKDDYDQNLDVKGYYYYCASGNKYNLAWSDERHDYSGGKVSNNSDGQLRANTFKTSKFSNGKITWDDNTTMQLYSNSFTPKSFTTDSRITQFTIQSIKQSGFRAYSVELKYQDKLICGSEKYGSLLEVLEEPSSNYYTDWEINFNDMPTYSTAKPDSYGYYKGYSTHSTAFIWHDQSTGTLDAFWGASGNRLFAEGIDVEKNYGNVQISYIQYYCNNHLCRTDYYSDLGYQSITRFYVYVGYNDEAAGATSITNVRSGTVTTINHNDVYINKSTLVVEAGAVLNIKGTLINNGTIRNYGTIYVQDGGTITNCLTQQKDTASILCFGTVRKEDAKANGFMTEGKKTEGSLVIGKGGRVIIGADGSLGMDSGCLLDCNGDLILPSPIISSDGGESLIFRSNSSVLIGATLSYSGFNTLVGRIQLASNRDFTSNITKDIFNNEHYFGCGKIGTEKTVLFPFPYYPFVAQLIFLNNYTSYTGFTNKEPYIQEGTVLFKHDVREGTYNGR